VKAVEGRRWLKAQGRGNYRHLDGTIPEERPGPAPQGGEIESLTRGAAGKRREKKVNHDRFRNKPA